MCVQTGRVAGQDHPASAGGDDLVAVEREAADVAKRAAQAAAVARAERLRGVLDHRQVVRRRELADGVHVGRVPVEMDDHDRPRRGRRACGGLFASIVNVSGSTSTNTGGGARVEHGVGAGRERQRGDQHLVARPEAERDDTPGAGRRCRSRRTRPGGGRGSTRTAPRTRRTKRPFRGHPVLVDALPQVRGLALADRRPESGIALGLAVSRVRRCNRGSLAAGCSTCIQAIVALEPVVEAHRRAPAGELAQSDWRRTRARTPRWPRAARARRRARARLRCR